MQAINLEHLLADVKTRTFNPIQNLASFQQTESNSLFSMLFDQTLQVNRNVEDSFLNNPIQNSPMYNSNTDYIDSFRKDLMSTGLPMERFSMSSQARDDIEQIMTGQGYPESEVNNFLGNVFQGGGSDTIKVSDFMKMYSEKKPSLEKNQSTPTVVASDVPVVEKGLKEFGLSASQVKVAIENSRTETGDLNLKQLAQELASISNLSLSADRQLSSDTQAAINKIFSKLGIEINGNGSLTFSQFVSVIKNVASSQSLGRLSQSKMKDLLASLMANIRQTTQRQDVLNIRQLYQSQLYQLPNFELENKDRPALENALRNMGFSVDEIQKIMAKVLNGSDKISLANLLDTLKTINPKLSEKLTVENLFNSVQLEKSMAKLNQSMLTPNQLGLDISKELQGVLKKLGLSDDEIQKLIASSRLPSGKIDMEQLIANLKNLSAQTQIVPQSQLTKADLEAIQKLMDQIKGTDKVNVSELLARLDTTDLNEQIKSILTQLGVPKEQIQTILTKAQGIQDSLSVQQLMAQLTSILEKAGVKTDDQQIKASLQSIESLLGQIQLTNQTISSADLADLKNMLKQYGASQDILNKVFPQGSDQKLTLAQFAKNLKDVLPQLDQGKKISIPANSQLKNILANLSNRADTQNTPKTLDAFVRQLETLPRQINMNAALNGKSVTIPSDYIDNLKAILKDLGFQSGKINDILPKTTQDISVQSLLAQLRPTIAQTNIPSDQLKEGFAKLNKLIALIQSKGKTDLATQLPIDKQKVVAESLSKIMSGESVQQSSISVKQVPLLEQLLVSYGMTQKDAQKLIAQAKTENGDVLMSKLSDLLQTFQNTRADNAMIKSLADHIDAYLALLKDQSTNKDLKKRDNNLSQRFFQNMKEGKSFDIKDNSQQNAKLADANQQARMVKMVTQSHGNAAETTTIASQADDNNSFLSFLKQESSAVQSSKFQAAQKLPERPVPYYLNQQVGRQLANAIRNNENQVTIQLRPPNLGTLKLDLEVQNNILRVGMATDNHLTRDLLVSHVNELKDALAEQGIRIDDVDIQINYDLGQSLANDQDQINERRRFFNFNNSDDESDENPDELAQDEIRRPIIYGDSSLSLIV
jgi:Holliday junction resolvasome RuvABC DNA-binding subunit/flagellar hook-length control protein FliK